MEPQNEVQIVEAEAGASSGFVKYKERLAPFEIAKICFWWLATFSGAYFYLSLSVLTGRAVSVGYAAIFASIFAVGYGFSAHFRCAVEIFFVQCFSRFGLCMLFLSASWISIQNTLESLIDIHKDLESDICMDNSDENSTYSTVINYDFLGNVVVSLHYSGLVPYLLIFVHGFLFIFTYIERVKLQNSITANTRNTTNSKYNQFEIVLMNVISFVIGSFFATTMALWAFGIISVDTVLKAVKFNLCRQRIMSKGEDLNISTYAVCCGIFFVLLPFSGLIVRLRNNIVRSHFDTNGGNLVPIKGNIVIYKPKETKITVEEENKSQQRNAHVAIPMEFQQRTQNPPQRAMYDSNDSLFGNRN